AVCEFEGHVAVEVAANLGEVLPRAAQLEAPGNGAAYVLLLEHGSRERRQADTFHLFIDRNTRTSAGSIDAHVAGVGAVEQFRRNRVQAHSAVAAVDSELQVLEQHAGERRPVERYPAARLQG